MMRTLYERQRARAATLAVAALFLFGTASPAQASHLGIGLAHVYATWENINDCLIAASQILAADEEMTEAVAAMTRRTFEENTLGDLATGINQHREALSKMFRRPSRALADDALLLTEQSAAALLRVSITILNEHVNWLLAQDDRLLVSQFYAHQPMVGEATSLSDLYALIDLANRRLAYIRARTGETGADGGLSLPPM